MLTQYVSEVLRNFVDEVTPALRTVVLCRWGEFRFTVLICEDPREVFSVPLNYVWDAQILISRDVSVAVQYLNLVLSRQLRTLYPIQLSNLEELARDLERGTDFLLRRYFRKIVTLSEYLGEGPPCPRCLSTPLIITKRRRGYSYLYRKPFTEEYLICPLCELRLRTRVFEE